MNRRDVVEIDLIDLFLYILKRWKVLILAGLIGGLLLGAYGGYKSYNPGTQPFDNSAELEKLSAGLTDIEKAEVQSAADIYVSYKGLYDDRLAYGENSLLLKLDPQQVYTGTTTYFISDYFDDKGKYVVENDNAGNIVAMYRAELTDDTTISFIKNVTGYNVDNTYIREIYSVFGDGVSLLKINVKADSQNTCEAILGVLEGRLEEVKGHVADKMDHNIEKVGTVWSKGYDGSIVDTQRVQNEALVNMQTAITKIPTSLTTDQQSYYKELIKSAYLPEQSEADASANAGNSINIKGIIKKAIIGIIAGVFLYACYLCCIYVFDQVLRTPDMLERACGSELLGVIGSAERKRRGIDGWLDKLSDKKDGVRDGADTYGLIAAAVSAGMDKKGVSKLFVTGSVSTEQAETVKSKIASLLPGKDVKAGASVLADPEAVKALSSSEAVLIVEQTGLSKYADICKEADICKNYGIDILGTVAVK